MHKNIPIIINASRIGAHKIPMIINYQLSIIGAQNIPMIRFWLEIFLCALGLPLLKDFAPSTFSII